MRTVLWDTKLATTRAVNSIRSWPDCIGCYSKECTSECSRTPYNRLHTTMSLCRQTYHPDGCHGKSSSSGSRVRARVKPISTAPKAPRASAADCVPQAESARSVYALRRLPVHGLLPAGDHRWRCKLRRPYHALANRPVASRPPARPPAPSRQIPPPQPLHPGPMQPARVTTMPATATSVRWSLRPTSHTVQRESERLRYLRSPTGD